MPTVTRLAGSVRRLILLRSDGPGRLVTVTLVEGESLPEGDLVAEATRGEDTVYLTPLEIDSSGEVSVEVEVFPEDFESYGSGNWDLVLAVDDAGSGSGPEDDTRTILFEGLVEFRQVAPRVVAATTVTTITGSGSGS